MAASTTTPLSGVDLILADLDGVIYRGAGAIDYAVESINKAGTAGIPACYLTNNASRTATTVAEHLTSLGLDVSGHDVVTSPQAAVVLLAELIPAGSIVLVVGGEGLTFEVEKAGFIVARSALDSPAAVIQGFSPDVGWKELAEASFALQATSGGKEIPWVATNMDWTIPVARGTAPGNGTLVSAVHTATGRMPEVAGKPEVPMFALAVERFGSKHPLVIGDRLDTDILGANRAGMASALVLTGIDQARELLAAETAQRPKFILRDLRELHEPYPIIHEDVDPDSSTVIFTVGNSTVRREGQTLFVDRAGDNPLNLLRAGTAAIWGSGTPIYGLRVPVELYS
jgi:glycerol-1-phosphatase